MPLRAIASPSRADGPPVRNERAWWSLLLGLLSAATMPAAIAATRWSETYELLHAAFAIPLGLILGVGAALAARSGLRANERTLGRLGGVGTARAGRLLGLLGVCLAVTAAISVGVYGLLVYVGTQE
jgi:hypothetical protein